MEAEACTFNTQQFRRQASCHRAVSREWQVSKTVNWGLIDVFGREPAEGKCGGIWPKAEGWLPGDEKRNDWFRAIGAP